MSEAKMTVKDPAEKLAHKRLRVLPLAEALGNITQACKRMKMDRTSFYEWKRRFQTHGIAGLKDMPPIHLTHPQTTPPEIVDRCPAACYFTSRSAHTFTRPLRADQRLGYPRFRAIPLE
jgi:hypothetical protein